MLKARQNEMLTRVAPATSGGMAAAVLAPVRMELRLYGSVTSSLRSRAGKPPEPLSSEIPSRRRRL